MERRGEEESSLDCRSLDDGLLDNARGATRGSGRRLRRRARVKQGVCGVNVPLRTPRRRKETRDDTQRSRKSAIKEKNVEVYSREKRFSPTSVVIKTNPLFKSSATPQRLPSNIKGQLQLNMYQQSYIAKTKEEEMVNAIIELAAHGERKYGKKVKRKSLFQKAKSTITRPKPVERNKSPVKRKRRTSVTPCRNRYSAEWIY